LLSVSSSSEPGGVTLDFASGVDIPSTLLAAARAPLPATYQGFDLLARLRAASSSAVALPSLVSSSLSPPSSSSSTSSSSLTLSYSRANAAGRTCVAATDLLGYGLVTKRWKLMYYPNNFGASFSSEARLFDMSRDPREHVNLWQAHKPKRHNQPSASFSFSSSSESSTSTVDDPQYAEEAWEAQQQLTEALLRWRARQDDLAQIWSQITRGAKYVGSFTSRAFALLENATGFDAEVSLQADCQGL